LRGGLAWAAIAALWVGTETVEPFGFENIEPTIDGIGVTGFEQAVAGDSMWGLRRSRVSDLQEGRTSFADIGARVMVTAVNQVFPLRGSEC
jgi:hypothetical protein